MSLRVGGWRGRGSTVVNMRFCEGDGSEEAGRTGNEGNWGGAPDKVVVGVGLVACPPAGSLFRVLNLVSISLAENVAESSPLTLCAIKIYNNVYWHADTSCPRHVDSVKVTSYDLFLENSVQRTGC